MTNIVEASQATLIDPAIASHTPERSEAPYNLIILAAKIRNVP